MRYAFVTSQRSSELMRRIKSTNTTPERIFGKLLWAQGIHYRKHSKELPGKPDFSISKYKIAIFIDGEFWHGFDWDTRKSRLKSNRDYWIPKIERNIERDREINSLLEEAGWNVVRYWGVEIEKQSEACVNGIIELIKRVKNAG